MDETYITVTRQERVTLITLTRPEAMNALCSPLLAELNAALDRAEADPQTAAVVLTGSDSVFAAGADITEIAGKGFAEVYSGNFVTRNWERLTTFRKPVIAAVSGYALGGGFELALMCDLIVASETAKFGLPETGLGILPGAGGTQRVARAAGKSVAMDMVLTGRTLSAEEALSFGLIARTAPPGAHLELALSLAQKIATRSAPVMMLAKEAVNHAFETSLSEGVYLERRLLYACFALEDQREGLAAFAEKRRPRFSDR